MIAHLPVKISGHKNSNRNLDAFIFSGHKTYAPGSPGAVICRKDILREIEPEEVGGGMVDDVFLDRYTISEEFPTREEAGTPNIAGAIGLAAVLEVLDTIGMGFIYKVESQLINNTLKQIKQIPNVHIYGETDYSICPRSACLSFNIKDMDHGLVAAILNDYHNIAVRNECFCAHPYVKEMILDDLLEATIKINEENFEDAFKLKSGMVRASFGIYNTDGDAKELVKAIKNISENRDYYSSLYSLDEKGNYVHSSFKMNRLEQFSIKSYVDHYVNQKQV
jgi:selenocysteine lyase/cysteine desulfurase